MLYPIELLGRAGGSMLASIGAFVMPAPLYTATSHNGRSLRACTALHFA